MIFYLNVFRCVLVPERPLQSQSTAAKIIGECQPVFRLTFGPGRYRRRISGTIPAIGSPRYRFNQSLSAEGMITIGVGVVNNPPVAVGIVDNRTVALRPPVIFRLIGMDYRVVGRIFPRAEYTFRTGGNHHVTRRWTGSASLCGGHVIITVMVIQLGRFQTHTLGFPV